MPIPPRSPVWTIARQAQFLIIAKSIRALASLTKRTQSLRRIALVRYHAASFSHDADRSPCAATMNDERKQARFLGKTSLTGNALRRARDVTAKPWLYERSASRTMPIRISLSLAVKPSTLARLITASRITTPAGNTPARLG